MEQLPVRYIERTHAWYNLLGYGNPYRYAQFSNVPFTLPGKPLAQSRLALLTTAAPFQKDKGDQSAAAPYNAAAKFYAMYSGDTAIDHDLRVSHVAVHRKFLSDDNNCWFPLPALRRAQAAGRIGALTARFFGVPTNRSQRHTLEVDCPALLAACQQDSADLALLVPNCPVCHQTMSLVARYLETHGVPTVIMGAARDIVEHCGVPRFLFSDVPLGNAAGIPNNVPSQDATLARALNLFETAFAARTTVQSPLQWPGPPDWRDDYLNTAQLSAAEIASQRAANDGIKAVAQNVRDATLQESARQEGAGQNNPRQKG